MSVQKNLLCPFHCKPRPSGVSLESPGLENIPQVPGIGAEVDQIHDARNVVSATVLVLKLSDFDQLRLNFPGLGGYFLFPGTLN